MAYTLIDATTISRLKYALKIEQAELGQDTLLQTFVTAVSECIQTHIDRPLLQQSITQECDYSPGQSVIYLDAYPVASISSVKFSSSGDFSGTTATTGYRFRSSTGEVYLNDALAVSEYSFGFRRDYMASVQIIYVAGIATSTVNLIAVAPTIAEAADIWAVEMFRRRDNPGATLKKLGENSFTREAELKMPTSVREMLFPLVRRRGAA